MCAGEDQPGGNLHEAVKSIPYQYLFLCTDSHSDFPMRSTSLSTLVKDRCLSELGHVSEVKGVEYTRIYVIVIIFTVVVLKNFFKGGWSFSLVRGR